MVSGCCLLGGIAVGACRPHALQFSVDASSDLSFRAFMPGEAALAGDSRHDSDCLAGGGPLAGTQSGGQRTALWASLLRFVYGHGRLSRGSPGVIAPERGDCAWSESVFT